MISKIQGNSGVFLDTLESPHNECLDCEDDIYNTLSRQIWNKFQAHKQSDENFNKKMSLCQRYNNYIKGELPHTLFVTGSTLNGFGLEKSDVDLVLLENSGSCSNKYAEDILERILICLQKYGVKGKIILANVPIIKIIDYQSNISVDIMYNNSNSIRNTQLLYCYSKIDWRVRPLCIIVKLWAKYREIDEARCGTLSSYAWVLMMIHFLQSGVQPAVLPCLQIDSMDNDIKSINSFTKFNIEDHVPSSNTDSLAKLFAGFLYYYYREFECNQYVISVREGKRLYIREYRKHCIQDSFNINKRLYIEDPFTLDNISKSMLTLTNFRKVKRSFKKCYKKLMRTNFDLGSILK